MHFCSTCEHWSAPEYAWQKGECRRHAPRVVASVSGFLTFVDTSLKTKWPRTASHEWCGEWEQRKPGPRPDDLQHP